MKNEELPNPLSLEEQRLLRRFVSSYEMPADAEARLLSRMTAVAAAATAPAVAAKPLAAAAWTAKSVVGIAVVAATVGATSGFLVGKRMSPSASPPALEAQAAVDSPSVKDRAPTTVEAPAKESAVTKEEAFAVEAPPKERAGAPKKSSADALLEREHHLVETARAALLHSDVEAAVRALSAHAKDFPQGRLEEEREALWIQALIQQSSPAKAREKLAGFKRSFPHSLLIRDLEKALAEKNTTRQ